MCVAVRSRSWQWQRQPQRAARPPLHELGLSLSKRFTLGGNHSISVRGDFLNAFNQDNYGNPISNMTSTDFGKNTNDWGNRAITLGVSYQF